MLLNLLALAALCAFSPAQAAERAKPPQEGVPALASKWSCARPAVKACGKGEACPAEPEEAADAKDHAVELKCLVDWLTEFSKMGSSPDQAERGLYEKERARAQKVIRLLQAWLGSAKLRSAAP